MLNKDRILSEIKRTAAANSGTPLGWRKFFGETGIRDSDWLRYWPRWGDAVREAGYNPNEKTIAFSDEFLIEKFIAFTRELGKFPTVAELKIRKRIDSSFPNAKAFERFGTKSNFAKTIVEYCSKRSGLDDIIKLCTIRQDTGEQTIGAPAKDTEEFGFVYLLKSGRHYKIGKTNATGRRERELAIQLPDKVKTVHVIRTDDPHGIEAYWHRRFEAKRKNGEWFELGTTEISAFRRRKFM
ncbi:MAG: GIY-YIG nuclease family protein [Alphaproteobacteria bacterium]|nr:GIY-YIG nuclease family protein [Alphaproteobacteria bacterium]